MSLAEAAFSAGMAGYTLSPVLSESTNWKHWISIPDNRRCEPCENLHGKIWHRTETPAPKPPLHPRGRCIIHWMTAIAAGTATINGQNGADYTLQNGGTLPGYYIPRDDIETLGWEQGKWPSNFAPDKMISGGEYKNKSGHLPQRAGRVWYEADINYTTGRRDGQRIVYSNDGLIFVTYDHYHTFYEIV